MINQLKATPINNCFHLIYTKAVVALLFLFVLFAFQPKMFSQPLPAPSMTAHSQFNTSINLTCNGATPVLGQDPRWRVSTTPFTIGSPAIVASATMGCFWSGGWGNNFPYSNWIAPNVCNSNDPTNYACQNQRDFWYSITFTVAPNHPFVIDWIMFASGWVEEIWVNTTLAKKTHGSNSNPPFHGNVGQRFRYCDEYRPAPLLNTIWVLVRNVPNQSPFCWKTGLKVESWWPGPSMYPTITGNTLVCPGTTNLYTMPTTTALGFPHPPAYTYSWTKPPTWGGNSTTHTLLAIAGTNSGTITSKIYSYYYAGGQQYKNCLSSAAIKVTVPPPLTITPTPTSICQGQSITLSASGAASYTWFAPPPGSPPISLNSSAIVSPNATTNYTVKANTLIGGCIYTRTVTVNVLMPPVVSISTFPTNSIVCGGQAAVLSGITNVLNPSYYWAPLNSTLSIIQFTPTQNTTYTLYAQGPNGCIGSKTTNIYVIPSPTVSASTNSSVICPGNSATLTASGASTYFWQNTNPTSTQTTVVVSPINTTTFSVLGTSVMSNTSAIGTLTKSCSKTGTVVVTVLSQPTVVVTPPQICPGIQNTLTPSGANNYTWYIGAAPNQTVYNGVTSLVLTLNAVTPYTVCGDASPSTTCISCFSGVINFGNPIPVSAPNVTLCTNAGACTNISASSTLSVPVTYLWEPGPLTGPTVNVCPPSSAVYTVHATSLGNVGCPSSNTLAVSVVSNCCAQSTASITVLNAAAGLNGLYQNSSYLLNSSTTLNSNTTFSNAEVWITPGVKITVPAGTQLNLEKAHLFACGINMWQGIEIQDGGRITTPNARFYSSFIEDAEVGIDLSNISLTNTSPLPPIDIQRVIFNKNHIGIKISNSAPTLDSLALGITGCVFTTRTLTFTTFPNPNLNWPSAEMSCSIPTITALRCPTGSTAGLAPPYLNFPNFMLSPLKLPHNNEPGYIGIKIEKFGNQNGVHSTPGVQFGITYNGYINDDFNLFDGLAYGIDVIDASLTTMNNVFQNMQNYLAPPSFTSFTGGVGINHEILETTIMNARQKLTSTNINTGNRFWNCVTGVHAKNVYDMWVRDAIFRSNHTANTAQNPVALPGDTGIAVFTNRFDFTVKESQFNNLEYGIVFCTPTTTCDYDVIGNGPQPGILVRGIFIERNYFGAEVNSATPYSSGGFANTTEYMAEAVHIESPIVNGWAYHPLNYSPSSIVSNKIDRAFRGISVNGMEDTKIWIDANDINIEDDFTFGNPHFGYGISLKNSTDNRSISFNTITAQPWSTIAPPLTPTVSSIYCHNNFGMASPRIECNMVKNSHIGFHFDGWNGNTIWEGNEMCTHFAGLALINNAVIGTQGNSSFGSGNSWQSNTNIGCSPWNTQVAFYQTYCEDSDPDLSFLWVRNNAINEPLLSNFTNWNPWGPYFPGPSSNIDHAPLNRLEDCFTAHGYLHTPNWKTNSTNQNTSILVVENKKNVNVNIYPNPTNQDIVIEFDTPVLTIDIKIYTVTGVQVLEQRLSDSYKNNIALSNLKPGVYLLSLQEEGQVIITKKLIITE